MKLRIYVNINKELTVKLISLKVNNNVIFYILGEALQNSDFLLRKFIGVKVHNVLILAKAYNRVTLIFIAI